MENLQYGYQKQKSDNLENIEQNNNNVDVLLFKQAIAVGWDCPRAAILVIFRETRDLTFTIQVVGRIMRMPEQKHYTKNPELNYGYIFTNIEKIDLAEEYVKDYAQLFHTERNDKLYEQISLHSTYLKRQRERTRLSGKFLKLFYEAAKEESLKDKINLNINSIASPLIVDEEIENIDEQISIEATGEFEFNISEVEIQRQFDSFIISSCKPFAPFDSSDRLKTALYNWLSEKFNVEKLSTKAQVVILSSKNIEIFFTVINKAKEKYKKDVIENMSNIREHVEDDSWEIPLDQSHSNAKKMDYKKYVMTPGCTY